MAIEWPEAGWERPRPYLDVSLDEAARLVAPLGRARGLELLRGGKANTNYRVRMEGHDDVVLRIYERQSGARAPGLLEREARLFERLHPSIPAPPLLLRETLSSGEPVGVLPFIAGEHPYAVMHADNAGALGRACGETLARLARHHPEPVAGLYADDLSLARRFDSIAESFVDLIGWSLRRGRARRRLPPPLRAELGARVDTLARALEPLDAHLCLAHGDYKFSNMLVIPRGDGFELSALLDWEFAGPFTPLLDIAILLRHSSRFAPGFVEAFGDSYRRAGAWLPPDWLHLTRIVDLMNLVGFLNGTSARPRLQADVIEKISVTLAAC